MEEIYSYIKQGEETYSLIDNKIQEENLITKAGETEKDEIFINKNLEPKKISKDSLILNQIIKINGNFCEADFMNSLYRRIRHKFENNIFFEASKNSLNMEVIFENEEDEEEKEESEEKKEKVRFGDCKMEIELFMYEKGNYLLEFRRTGGNYPDYYQHFLEIQKIITQEMNNKK